MKRFIDNLQQQWKGMAPQRRILLAAAVATLAIGAFVVNSRMSQVDWAVLYANVDDTTASDVLARLDPRGIEHKLDGNGTRILVPRDQLDSTRIALAAEGVSGQAVPAGFEEVFDNQGLSTTDFAQQVNYERGLEGELARTLLSLDPVDGANVQLSIPEKSVFVGSTTDPSDVPSASVLLDLNRPLNEDEVNTVASVIAGGVPGLTLEAVTIASTDGTLLKAAGASGGTGAGSSSLLELTQQYEVGLEQGLTAFVRKLTGSNDASVQVSADLDFSTSTVESRELDPDRNVPTAESHTLETWEGTGIDPAGVVGVDGGPDGSGTATDGSYEKTADTITYNNGGEVVTKTNNNTPSVKRLGIAVVIPPMPEDATLTTADVEAAVRSAANLDDERGDSITVVEGILPAAVTDETEAELITDPVVTPAAGVSPMFVAAAAVGGAILMLVLGAWRRRRKAKRARIAAALAAAQADPTLIGLPATAGENMGAEGKKDKSKKTKKRKGETDDPTELVPATAGSDLEAEKQAMDEIKADLEKILAESPESLATLLSSWMTK